MSDIEKLLAAASDDADQPLQHSVDDIVRRGRRSVRRRRIATASTVALTAAAIVGGVTTWSATRPGSMDPAGSSASPVAAVDAETRKAIAPAPPVSPLDDSTIIEKCMVYDKMPTWDPKPWNKPGVLTSRWHVAVKTGDAHTVKAILVAPDRSIGAYCQIKNDSKAPSGSYGRFPVTDPSRNGTVFRAGYADGLNVPGDVRKILVEVPGEAVVRQALMGTDGFYTLGTQDRSTGVKPSDATGKPRIRGYAADGSKILDRELPFVVGLPPIPER